MDYLKEKIITAIVVVFSVGCFYTGYLAGKESKQATQQQEPCICPTYQEIAANTARMEVYIDSSQNGRKKDRARFSDSVLKYKLLLKIK